MLPIIWLLFALSVFAILGTSDATLLRILAGNRIITPVIAKGWAFAISFLVAFAASIRVLIHYAERGVHEETRHHNA